MAAETKGKCLMPYCELDYYEPALPLQSKQLELPFEDDPRLRQDHWRYAKHEFSAGSIIMAHAIILIFTRSKARMRPDGTFQDAHPLCLTFDHQKVKIPIKWAEMRTNPSNMCI